MAITYPLAMPNMAFASVEWTGRSVVGSNPANYTMYTQTVVWPGQWWEVSVHIPPITDPLTAGIWIAFLLALRGKHGSFYLGPSLRRASLGSISGTLQVGAGAQKNSTTLPLQGGSGLLAIGDWIQVGDRLHKVIQVNSSTSVDVFPVLRDNYTQGNQVVYSNPVGKFSLTTNDTPWTEDNARVYGIDFAAMERVP